jgi:uncharacterized membrane protein YeaQ/YmgE (transglycosylase-associated protein family)
VKYNFMNFLIWIVFGALAGWLASIIMGTDAEQGAMGNIVVGIIGAFLGGFVMNMIGQPGVTGFNFYSTFVAILGAVVLLWIYRMFSHRRV